MKRYCTTIIVMGLVVLLPWPVFACVVPVFRYALERWPPDYYEAVLLHRGELAADEKQLLDELRQAADWKREAALNLRVHELDITSLTDDRVKNLLRGDLPETLPALALWYPGAGGRARPVWLGEFTPATVAALVQSPTRRELAERLMKGQSAVWLFVESGVPDKDKAALWLLRKELEKGALELKEMAPPDIDEFLGYEVLYEFSILTLSRSDPQEHLLLTLLLHSEPGFDEYADEPIVFPVFGRGRALYALVGPGITQDNIQEAIAFLGGPCSCQIKALNPGVDLLMSANWDAAVMEFYEQDWSMPELTGVMPEPPAVIKDTNVMPEVPATSNDINVPTVRAEEPPGLLVGDKKGGRLGVMGTTGVVLAVILLVVALGSLAVSRRTRKEQ